MRLLGTLSALLMAALWTACADSKKPASDLTPSPPEETPTASVDSLLGNPTPPVTGAPAQPRASTPARSATKPSIDLAAEEREYQNWEQSSRRADWDKMLQIFVSDNKGRFPGSIEELAKAYGRPLPPLPAGSVLYIDRTNKVVRLKRF